MRAGPRNSEPIVRPSEGDITAFLAALTLLAFLVMATGSAGAIGLGDLKKKAEKKLKERVEKKEDAAADAAADAAEDAAESAVSGSEEAGEKQKDGAAKREKNAKGGHVADAGPKRAGPVASVSPKFDFIPGDRTISAADFSALKPGEPPAAWKPRLGSAIVEESDGARWLAPKGDQVVVRIPLDQPLPMKWTLEIDYATTGAEGATFQLAAEDAAGTGRWSASWPLAEGAVRVEAGSVTASGTSSPSATGRHRILFAGSGAGLRVYLDRERVLAAPTILQGEPPTSLVLTMKGSGSHPRIASVRLASGPASAKSRLAGGSLATYGVQFDLKSDEVKPESAPLLREVASFLESDGAAKLSIQALADDVEEEGRRSASAKKRATSVRDVLVSQFGVPALRLVVADVVASEKGGSGKRRAGEAVVVFSRN